MDGQGVNHLARSRGVKNGFCIRVLIGCHREVLDGRHGEWHAVGVDCQRFVPTKLITSEQRGPFVQCFGPAYWFELQIYVAVYVSPGRDRITERRYETKVNESGSVSDLNELEKVAGTMLI